MSYIVSNKPWKLGITKNDGQERVGDVFLISAIGYLDIDPNTIKEKDVYLIPNPLVSVGNMGSEFMVVRDGDWEGYWTELIPRSLFVFAEVSSFEDYYMTGKYTVLQELMNYTSADIVCNMSKVERSVRKYYGFTGNDAEAWIRGEYCVRYANDMCREGGRSEINKLLRDGEVTERGFDFYFSTDGSRSRKVCNEK